MNPHKTDIHFDLLANARDSIRQAVELLAYPEQPEPSQLKHAIMFSAHSVELLLKEKLRQINPAFVWENVDKYPSLEARTVTPDTAIARLKNIGGITFSASDESNLRSLRLTRNAIEHYEWKTTATEAKVIIGTTLSFAFSFASDHLNMDLAEPFKKDDTLLQLLSELWEFSHAHGQRLEAKLKAHSIFTVPCGECGWETVTQSGTCEVCGHWQDIDDLDEHDADGAV